MHDGQSKKLWGGSFTGEADRGFAEFNQSFSFDRRLFEADIRASVAHCEGLVSAGVLTAAEAEQIKSRSQPNRRSRRKRIRTISMSYRRKMCIRLLKLGWCR